jgi:hypothetical protein
LLQSAGYKEPVVAFHAQFIRCSLHGEEVDGDQLLGVMIDGGLESKPDWKTPPRFSRPASVPFVLALTNELELVDDTSSTAHDAHRE